MRTILFFCISTALITASSLLAGCSAGGDSGTPQAQASGEPAAALAVAHWVKGNPVDISNGVHVVEFWATWCPPCRTSIPHLTQIQQQYKERGVNIIGISDEELSTVESFVTRMGSKMNYAVAIDEGRSTSKGYMGKYGVNGIPHAFVVKDGTVVWHGHPMNKLEAAIDDALK